MRDKIKASMSLEGRRDQKNSAALRAVAYELVLSRVLRMVSPCTTNYRIESINEMGALSLSLATVRTYRVWTLQKMGLTTAAQLMQYAIQNGLVLRRFVSDGRPFFQRLIAIRELE